MYAAFNQAFALILNHIADIPDGWDPVSFYELVFVCGPDRYGTPAYNATYLVVRNLYSGKFARPSTKFGTQVGDNSGKQTCKFDTPGSRNAEMQIF